MTKYPPFPEGDDFNELADRLRKDVTGLILLLQDDAVYCALTPVQQIECVLAGLTTALVGCCFSMVEETGRKPVLKAIKNYLPQAAANAKGILTKESGS